MSSNNSVAVVKSSKAEISFPSSIKCFYLGTLKEFCKLAADFPKIVSLVLKCSTIELDKKREVFLPPFVVTLGLCGDLSSSSNSLQMHFLQLFKPCNSSLQYRNIQRVINPCLYCEQNKKYEHSLN
ncbi:hypothetical protein TNIN_97201 [Trichonephila inaurata madagascariensis]|uniref:Uncharacterized protein n=1 Tax=Trichonephila inaurata madagascariensis TaxID=2747483 RepID=A0A8X7CCF9_9ARAC|nr:hypothetical protein TNIN_97201 [Trichonephila inaurata madagascariensis]